MISGRVLARIAVTTAGRRLLQPYPQVAARIFKFFQIMLRHDFSGALHLINVGPAAGPALSDFTRVLRFIFTQGL